MEITIVRKIVDLSLERGKKRIQEKEEKLDMGRKDKFERSWSRWAWIQACSTIWLETMKALGE